MQFTQDDATPGENPLGDAIEKRLGDIESGRYEATTRTILYRFARWARRAKGVTNPGDIDSQTLREYSRTLSEAVEDDDESIGTNSTAEQYYDTVSAFLGWCVREELIESNPALSNRAREPLPVSDEENSPQFWTERERKAICATADQLVDEVLESDYSEREKLQAYRDRALVYTLAYTGVRGAEIGAVRNDRKRNGLRWTSVDLDTGVLTIYGKTRTHQSTPILDSAINPLQRWEDVLDPDLTWPVFPTMHLPSLYGRLPDDVESSPNTVWAQLLEHDRDPPALKVDGMRRVLRKLCDQSQYEFEEPLTPHGARRGLGDQLYKENAELAQEVLRHQDIETTHKSYRDQKVSNLKKKADQVLDE